MFYVHGVVCVATLPLWHVCWYRGFCHRTGSDLLLFVCTFAKFSVFSMVKYRRASLQKGLCSMRICSWEWYKTSRILGQYDISIKRSTVIPFYLQIYEFVLQNAILPPFYLRSLNIIITKVTTLTYIIWSRNYQESKYLSHNQKKHKKVSVN